PPMTKLTASELEHLSEAELQSLLIPDLLPRHIAVIMDGNGRWAAQRGMPRMAGHTEGIKSVRELITLCRDLGIKALTIYAFSQENWRRPASEINALMALLEHYLQMEMEALIEQGARFRAIGRINTLPESALAWVRKVERATAHLDTLNLTVALSYGGRSEIVDAVRRLAEDVKRDVVKPDQIDEDLLEGYLSTHGLPDPDLLIRTSGETPISNLLAQYEYYRLHFPHRFSAPMGLGLLCGLLITTGFAVPSRLPEPASVTFIIMAILLSHAFSGRDLKTGLLDTAVVVFGAFYVAWLLGHLILIDRLANGPLLIFFLFLVTWANDTAAYYVGTLLGRHPQIGRAHV